MEESVKTADRYLRKNGWYYLEVPCSPSMESVVTIPVRSALYYMENIQNTFKVARKSEESNRLALWLERK